MNYEIDPEEEKLRAKISEILVKWDMPTRQVAISEIIQACGMYAFLAGQKAMREEIQEFIANYTVDLCENSQQFRNDLLAVITPHTGNE